MAICIHRRLLVGRLQILRSHSRCATNLTQGSLVRGEEDIDTTSSPATGTWGPDQKQNFSSGSLIKIHIIRSLLHLQHPKVLKLLAI